MKESLELQEQHGFRYTQYKGKARMEMKAGLTFACMNLKKLAKILAKREERNMDTLKYFSNRHNYFIKIEKLVWSFAPIPTLSTVCSYFLFIWDSIIQVQQLFFIYLGQYNTSANRNNTTNN